MEEKEITNDLKRGIVNNIYYIIIGVLSLICCLVIPLFTGGTDWGAIEARDVGDWVLYVAGAVGTAIGNMIIFYCFMQQGKVNSKNDPNYLLAIEILREIYNKTKHKKTKLPRSPKKWSSGQYLKKGCTITLGSIIGAFTFGQAILRYDVPTFLSYVLTVSMGLIFGVLQMKASEEYWTNEFYDYALLEKQKFEEEKNNDSSKQQTI